MQQLIIGGPPKCGTSSIFNWLADHPEISPSTPKETFFFMDHNNPLINKEYNFHKDGIEGFDHFFNKNDKTRLEGTTHTIYQKDIAKWVSEFPNVKMVFLLREPASRAYSSFLYTKHNLASIPAQITFKEYLENIQNEITPEWLDKCPSKYVLKNDIKYGEYETYIAHWLNFIPKENILILLFEDLAENSLSVITKICDFVDIDSSFYKDYNFKAKNQTIQIKSRWIHKLAVNLNNLIPFRSKEKLKSFYLKFQGKKKEHLDEDLESLQQLKNHYIQYNNKLADLLNIDLSKWN